MRVTNLFWLCFFFFFYMIANKLHVEKKNNFYWSAVCEINRDSSWFKSEPQSDAALILIGCGTCCGWNKCFFLDARVRRWDLLTVMGGGKVSPAARIYSDWLLLKPERSDHVVRSALVRGVRSAEWLYLMLSKCQRLPWAFRRQARGSPLKC